ncbi:MAG: cereblon family protein [Desulfobacteraceae bacterium]
MYCDHKNFLYGFECFKKQDTDPELDLLEKESAETREKNDKGILCAFCKNRIASTKDQIVVNGSHDHIFANPHGLVFEVVCYRKADGCSGFSQLTREFTWFPGYSWKVAVCRFCAGHLGWFFLSETHSFYGLIAKNLILPHEF